MDKQFSFEAVKTKEREDYHTTILNIINDMEQKVRYVVPDPSFSTELHKKKVLDSRREIADFETVRKDVCESFGIPQDSEHVYIHDSTPPKEAKEQRALRAFYVMIDAVKKEGFYGEGRIDHNTLLNRLIDLAKRKDSTLTFDAMVEKINEEPPHILVFKGFLSIKEFKELSDSARKLIESPLYDKNGEKIETAEEWFLTGHNLESVLPDSPKN